MNAINIDVIACLALVASFGVLFGAIKMYRTAPPQLGTKQKIERDF